MLTSDAINKFGSIRQLARELDISVQAVYAWGDTVPPLRVYQIRDILAARSSTPGNSEAHQAAA